MLVRIDRQIGVLLGCPMLMVLQPVGGGGIIRAGGGATGLVGGDASKGGSHGTCNAATAVAIVLVHALLPVWCASTLGSHLGSHPFSILGIARKPNAVDVLEMTPSLLRALETCDEEAHFSVTE